MVVEPALDPAEQRQGPPSDVTTITLADGAVVELHPMRSDDAGSLLRFHHGLSPESIYLRFFGVHPELTEKELYRFTHVDHRDREALVAVVEGEIVGVARFDRLEHDDEAEVALVIADSWQGRGLGSVLFDRLTDRARRLGVIRFVAETLPQNRRMLAVFQHSGLPVETRFDGGVIHVTIEL
jgi:RimJ/RimL family protein N-acetyltransferase